MLLFIIKYIYLAISRPRYTLYESCLYMILCNGTEFDSIYDTQVVHVYTCIVSLNIFNEFCEEIFITTVLISF